MQEFEFDSTKTVHKILGNCNCVVVVADGYPYGEKTHPLTLLAAATIQSMKCYGIVNTKYKESIVNLTNTELIRKNKRITKEYLLPLVQFKEEIRGNGHVPLIVILQTAEETTLSGANIPKVDLVLGIGQGVRGKPRHPHRPTFPLSIINKLRLSLADNNFSTELAPPASIFCGHESTSLNQLFSEKNFLEDLYDPNVQSLLLTINNGSLTTNPQEMKIMGECLAKGFEEFTEQMPLVRKVRRSSIEIATQKDQKYIFRVQDNNDSSLTMLREAYVDELAQSIEKSGLIHPLVLLQKSDGKYKILCGYRRFQALTQLNKDWIEAKIYQESDFTKEDFFDISLAENTKRRNLNPVEIGNFLERAALELGLNNASLAEKFGQTLGIGKPNQNVSQSTIHKYRKINDIRLKGESSEIINDIINEKLQFTIAAEILAPIKDAEDRNSFYYNIVKTLSATRAQAIQIKKFLEVNEKNIKSFLQEKNVQLAIEKALLTEHKCSNFIKFLQKKRPKANGKPHSHFQKNIETIRKSLFKDAPKNDFKISKPAKGKKKEITLQLKLRPDNLHEAMKKLALLSQHEKELLQLFDKKMK